MLRIIGLHQELEKSIIENRWYMAEKMPTRHTTAGGYRNYLEGYCVPKWGGLPLSEIQPMEVWLWLKGMQRAGKTKAHIKSVMRQVFEFSVLANLFPIQRNPMDLETVEGASKRAKVKRVLTYDEWERFIARVTGEPQRTTIITYMCLGIGAKKFGHSNGPISTLLPTR